MSDREAVLGELGERRLDVADRGLASGRITDMADRRAPGELANDRVLVEIAGDMPIARCEWKCLPSKLVMPAASWPRCCKAWSPSATKLAASSAPQMPNTPHSSRNLSSSNGFVVSIVGKSPAGRRRRRQRHIVWQPPRLCPRLEKA